MPTEQNFMPSFPCFLQNQKCSASREAVVSINFSANSANQNNQIRMN